MSEVDKATKKCSHCGEPTKIKNYVKNDNNPDKRDCWCNNCRKKVYDEDTLIEYCKENNRGYSKELFKDVFDIIDNKLKKMNNVDKIKDYNKTLLQKTVNLYFSKMNLIGNEGNKIKEETKNKNIKTNKTKLSKEELNYLIDRWGIGYKNEEYSAFEKKYSLLKNNYPEKTAMHTEALLNYIRYRVKEEIATAKGDVKDAKEWGSLAQKAAQDAKINPSQLTKADLSDGLSTFSELAQAVEKEIDIIPILPRFKYRPNDAIDFNIWCYINYMRDLSGLPLCKYEDIYAFYDKRKKDYIEQYGDPYGIFTDDPTEKNRKNIIKFIKEDGD
jgi:hypothetical protein